METMSHKMYLLATEGHRGQKRSNEDYVCHPCRVAAKFEDEFRKTLGYGHDLKEDHPKFFEEKVVPNFPKEIINGLWILSRMKGETYFDYIFSICHSNNIPVIEVKIEDINDNLSNLPEGSFADKYRFARFILRKKLSALEDALNGAGFTPKSETWHEISKGNDF